MKNLTGRVVAVKYNYDGSGIVISTLLYFSDGAQLLLAGYLRLSSFVTLEFEYKKNDGELNELKSIKLMAG